MLRMLRVTNISLSDKIIIEGNEVDLHWKVKGCHKIKIKSVGTARGNSHGIKFKMVDITKPIEVYFFGIGKTEHTTIYFIGDRINLLNKFISQSLVPVPFSASHPEQKLTCDFSNLKLHTQFDRIFFEIDSFDSHEYQTQNITQ